MKAPIVLILAGLTAAKNVYLDCTSSGEGDGSKSEPFTTIDQVNDYEFKAGDSLNLKKGSHCKGVLQPQGNGSKERPISIINYGSGALPIIDGEGAQQAVLLHNQDYWKISGLNVTNPADEIASRNGIRIIADDDKPHVGITIQNVVVSDVAGQTDKDAHPTDFANSSCIVLNGQYDDVTISHNSVSDCGGGGIKIRPGYGQGKTLGQNTLVDHNNIKDCGGDGIIVSYSESPLIEYNTAVGLGTGKYPWTGGNFAGIWVLGSHNSIMQYNVVTDSIMSKFDSEAFDCDWGNTGYCLIQYNFARDNAGGIFLNCDGCGGDKQYAPDQILRYNVFQNDCRMISTGDKSKLHFYNNVVYCPEKNFEIAVPKAANFTNNIFVGNDNSTLPDSAEWLNNIFMNVDSPSDGGDNLKTDPLFVKPGSGAGTLGSASGYKLKSDSPALGSGSIIQNNGGKDYFGNKVSSTEKPNRGAYNGEGEK